MRTGPDLRTAMKYLMAGTEFLVAFGLGAAVGVYADRRRGGGTIWPMVGGAAGLAIGTWMLVRLARESRKDFDRKGKP